MSSKQHPLQFLERILNELDSFEDANALPPELIDGQRKYLDDLVLNLTSDFETPFVDKKRNLIEYYDRSFISALINWGKGIKSILELENSNKQSLNYQIAEFVRKMPQRFQNEMEEVLLEVNHNSNYIYSFNWLGDENQKELLYKFLLGDNKIKRVFISCKSYEVFDDLFSRISYLNRDISDTSKLNWIAKTNKGKAANSSIVSLFQILAKYQLIRGVEGLFSKTNKGVMNDIIKNFILIDGEYPDIKRGSVPNEKNGRYPLDYKMMEDFIKSITFK